MKNAVDDKEQITCLQVHNDYQITGGETKTAIGIANLLESNGIKVIRYYKYNNSFKDAGKIKKLMIGIKSLQNPDTKLEVERIIRQERIDFALVHNVLPIISNSIYEVLKRNHIPTIKYVQNYNLICLNGAIDHGDVCCKCKKSCINGVINACYKNSTLYSLIRYIVKRQFEKKYRDYISAFMSNSAFVKSKHEEYGMDTTQMSVMYNYIMTKDVNTSNPENYKSYYLYLGRIEPEKGILTCIKAFEKANNYKLVIMGSGSLEEMIKAEIKSYNHIYFIGEKSGDELKHIISYAKCVIVPSEWDDPLPRTILESLSMGIPFIAARRGGITEMIKPEIGFGYEAGNVNDLCEAINAFEDLDMEEYIMIRKKCIDECSSIYSKDSYWLRFAHCLTNLEINV